jgi:glycosyltransferase involved in cell wall biosynthesis
MRIMMVKSYPWSVEEFDNSIHPEYVAIRKVVLSFESNFALVGIGGRKYQRFRHPTLDLCFYNIPTANSILWLLSYPALLALVVILRPRVVFTMGVFIQIPIQFGADLVGARHVTAVIGEPFYLTGRMRFLCKVARLHFLLKVTLNRANGKMAISQGMKRDLAKIMGERAQSIQVYHYALSDIFRPDVPRTLRVNGSSAPLILTSCRIDRRKGLELVILAAAIVLDKIPEVNFVIRGPISDRGYFNELHAMIVERGLQKRVALRGDECDYEDLPGILSSADLFVHPSLDESLGIAIAEALACGVPVVATRVGGIPELVEHMVNGILVEPDPVAVSNAILRILSDAELREHLKQGARAFSNQIRLSSDTDFGNMLVMKIREAMST